MTTHREVDNFELRQAKGSTKFFLVNTAVKDPNEEDKGISMLFGVDGKDRLTQMNDQEFKREANKLTGSAE